MPETLDFPPLTDSELLEWENRARNSEGDWTAGEVMRLIAEVKRSRDEVQSPERRARFEKIRQEARTENAELMRRLA